MSFGQSAPPMLLGALTLASTLVHAQTTTPLDLHWTAPPGCPDGVAVERKVAQLLEHSPPTGTRVRVDALLVSRGDGWSLELTTLRNGALGHRSLQADSCRAVVDATALIIALTLDPAGVVPSPAVSEAAPPPSHAASPDVPPSTLLPAPPGSALPAIPARAAASTARTESLPAMRASARLADLHWAASTFLGGDLGSLPAPGFGVVGALALLLGRLRVEGYVAYWPSEPASVIVLGHVSSGTSTVTGGVHLLAGGALGCVTLLSSPRWELGPCAGLELGAWGGEASGVVSPTPRTVFWAAARVDARVTLRVLAHVGIVADLSLNAPLHRDSLGVDVSTGTQAVTTRQIAAPSVVSGRLFLGPEVRF